MQVKGTHHPALFTQSIYTSSPHWIYSPPDELYRKGEFYCQFRFQHVHPLIECLVKLTEENGLQVEFEQPLRAIAPGQYAVFHVGDEMIGSGQITRTGPSIQDLERTGHSSDAFRKMDLSGPFGC